MARIAISQQEALPDFISTENFEFVIGPVPGGGDPVALGLKVLQAPIAGFGNQVMSVNIAGFTRNFRGRKHYGAAGGASTLNVVFVEDATFATLNALRAWHEIIVGTNSGAGGTRAQYAAVGRLITYDQSGNSINETDYWQLFIDNVGEVQMTGESTNVFQVTCAFVFDYFTSPSTPAL